MDVFLTETTRFAKRFEKAFAKRLQSDAVAEPGAAPERLLAAVRHGALGGGKRLRPLLVVQSAAIFGVSEKSAFGAAMAVEMVHCYSLIHDDLPAMDDDDLRRGRPTVHKAFDDATAILAGDALLTEAFAQLADPASHPHERVRLAMVRELAQAAGMAGMVGGQMRDLEGEKGGYSHDDIADMQAMKTGALILGAVRMGGLLGEAGPDALEALTFYGRAAGRAFQLADDILDEVATTEQMGKRTGKDHARNKPTLVARLGVEAAQKHLGDQVHRAISSLAIFGPEADGLRQMARYFAQRTS